MFDNPAGVDFVYVLGGSIFLVALFAGFGWTLVRFVYYVLFVPRREWPVLLIRDVLSTGGLAFSFGLIAGIRFLPIETRLAITTGNVLWALLTTVPAAFGATVYLAFEAFVIRLRPKARPERPSPLEEVS